MELKDINAQIDKLMADATAIEKRWEGKADPMTKEDQDNLSAILGKVDEWQSQADLVKRKQKNASFMDDPQAKPVATSGHWRNSAPGEGDTDIDPLAWRSIKSQVVQVDPIFGVPVVTEREVRYHVPLAVQVKGYNHAFESYLRKGVNDVGPQDRKTLTEGVDSAGGFLVPEDYQVELIKKIATMATIRNRARVATTGRDLAKWPKVNYTTDDKYTSGVRLTWTGEAPSSSTAHRVTDPQFGLYSIPVHTAMASFPMSNDLIEDSAFDILGISSDLLAEAFTLDENNAFINGSGVGRPMGMLTQVDGDGPASVVSGSGSTLTADGIIDLIYALPAQYEANAVTIMSKATEKVIRKLKDSQNNYLWPVWPQVGNFGVSPRELLGYPVFRDEFMPAIASNAYPVIHGDLRGYLVLDRVGLSIQRLTDSAYAELNLTGLLARKRVGGQTIEPWRLKAHKIST
ncbi:MAG: phage major capsid protein [Desulfurellales bacterium]|jgi:HK97 family phage major capsid protein|nr:MAG: phage major capsid protein [Desulfurellales bacterium]